MNRKLCIFISILIVISVALSIANAALVSQVQLSLKQRQAYNEEKLTDKPPGFLPGGMCKLAPTRSVLYTMDLA